MSDICVTTISGRRFDLAEPSAADVELSDVVIQLDRINRFNGGTIRPYTVLEHSMLVALECYAMALASNEIRFLARHAAILGQMHDAAEAYTGDLTSPIKRLIGSRAKEVLGPIEAVVESALCGSIHPGDRNILNAEYVKPADQRLLRWEQANLRIGWMPQAEDDVTAYPLIEPAAVLRDMPLARRFAFYSLHEALVIGDRLPAWTGMQ